jgi:hypothetical protein
MKDKVTKTRRQRFILWMRVWYCGGMFLLFNFRFFRDLHDYTTPYIVFRLIFSGLIFWAGGFWAASRTANHFGMK